jgi:hypothetical protein
MGVTAGLKNSFFGNFGNGGILPNARQTKGPFNN